MCGGSNLDSLAMHDNLEPDLHDVDLNNRYGAPFGTATTNETFDMNVRIGASSTEDLKAYQIVIIFDDSLVQVNNNDDCVQGDDCVQRRLGVPSDRPDRRSVDGRVVRGRLWLDRQLVHWHGHFSIAVVGRQHLYCLHCEDQGRRKGAV